MSAKILFEGMESEPVIDFLYRSRLSSLHIRLSPDELQNLLLTGARASEEYKLWRKQVENPAD